MKKVKKAKSKKQKAPAMQKTSPFGKAKGPAKPSTGYAKMRKKVFGLK